MRRSWRVVLPLSLGRLAGYGALSLAAALAGQALKDPAAAPALRLLVGSAALMMGLALLWRRPGCTPAAPAGPVPIRFHEPRPLLPGGLFLMGIGMGLTPCAPLGVVMFSAAAGAGVAYGLALGLAFGLGAIVVPGLVFGIGAACLGVRLRQALGTWRPWLERLSAGLLILTGLSHLLR